MSSVRPGALKQIIHSTWAWFSVRKSFNRKIIYLRNNSIFLSSSPRFFSTRWWISPSISHSNWSLSTKKVASSGTVSFNFPDDVLNTVLLLTDIVFKISAYQLNFLCVGAKFRCSRLVRWRECVGIRRGSKIWCADTFWEGLVDFFRWFWREPKSWRMPSSANYQCSLFIPQLAMFFYVRTSEHGIHAEQKSKDDKR